MPGAPMVAVYRNSLSAGFQAKHSSPVQTMDHLKSGIKFGDKVVFDLKSIFLHLLTVGQQHENELLPKSGHELFLLLLGMSMGASGREQSGISSVTWSQTT